MVCKNIIKGLALGLLFFSMMPRVMAMKPQAMSMQQVLDQLKNLRDTELPAMTTSVWSEADKLKKVKDENEKKKYSETIKIIEKNIQDRYKALNNQIAATENNLKVEQSSTKTPDDIKKLTEFKQKLSKNFTILLKNIALHKQQIIALTKKIQELLVEQEKQAELKKIEEEKKKKLELVQKQKEEQKQLEEEKKRKQEEDKKRLELEKKKKDDEEKKKLEEGKKTGEEEKKKLNDIGVGLEKLQQDIPKITISLDISKKNLNELKDVSSKERFLNNIRETEKKIKDLQVLITSQLKEKTALLLLLDIDAEILGKRINEVKEKEGKKGEKIDLAKKVRTYEEKIKTEKDQKKLETYTSFLKTYKRLRDLALIAQNFATLSIMYTKRNGEAVDIADKIKKQLDLQKQQEEEKRKSEMTEKEKKEEEEKKRLEIVKKNLDIEKKKQEEQKKIELEKKKKEDEEKKKKELAEQSKKETTEKKQVAIQEQKKVDVLVKDTTQVSKNIKANLDKIVTKGSIEASELNTFVNDINTYVATVCALNVASMPKEQAAVVAKSINDNLAAPIEQLSNKIATKGASKLTRSEISQVISSLDSFSKSAVTQEMRNRGDVKKLDDALGKLKAARAGL